jgi:ribonuclease MRP protein subunit RMP1
MPPKPPLELEQIKLLRDDLDLLHLLFHRHKNQHRLLKWWQWFGTLRRNLNKLLAEHDLVTAAKSTPQRNEALQRYTKRAEFLRRIVAPSAYNSFCSVIANKNFAPLGLVLTGVLGRVWKIIRPTEELEEERVDLGAEAVLKSSVTKEMDKEMGVVSGEPYDSANDEVGVVVSRADYGIDGDEEEDGDDQRRPSEAELEDKGERSPLKVYSAPKLQLQKEKARKNRPKQPQGFVERASTPRSTMESGNTRTETIGSPSVEPVRKPKRKLGMESNKAKQKKKRKKADAIDDLFRGLF